MKKFEYFMPKTIEQAVEVLNDKKESVTIVAGGTDVVLELNEGHEKGRNMVDISKIEELKFIKVEDGAVKIGPMTTFTELEKSEYVKNNLKILHTMAVQVGSPQIRNLGTIGGNVINASVAGDSPASLIALDASLTLASKKGTRTVKLTEFNNEKGQGTKIESDELLVEISFPEPTKNVRTSFSKLAKRESLAIVVISTACAIEKDESGVCTKAQVVIGAVAPHPIRVPLVEEQLLGKVVNKENLYNTLDLFTTAVSNISNRPSVTYKKMSVKGTARKMFDEILKDFN